MELAVIDLSTVSSFHFTWTILSIKLHEGVAPMNIIPFGQQVITSENMWKLRHTI